MYFYDLHPEPIERLLEAIIAHAGFELRFTITERPSHARPRLCICFEGPDTALLLARQSELLHALEHLAASAARLELEDRDLLQFTIEP